MDIPIFDHFLAGISNDLRNLEFSRLMRPRSLIRRIGVGFAAVLVILMVYLTPAIINRSPILYPDTLGYYQSGEAALKSFAFDSVIHQSNKGDSARAGHGVNMTDGVSTARSVYYGTMFALSYNWLGLWAIAILQIAACVVSMWFTLSALTPLNHGQRWLVIVTTGAVTGVSVFAATALPDVFAGLLILAIAMLCVPAHRPRCANRSWWWFSILLLAALFHKSHLAIAILLLATATLWRSVGQRNESSGLKLAWAATVFALAGHLAVDYEVRTRLGIDPISPPFILARMIGDRTAETFLRENCQRRSFETCRAVPHMPMTENEFLWSTDPLRGGFALLDLPGKRQVLAEQSEIIEETLSSNGKAQLLMTLSNAWQQIVSVGVGEYGLIPTGRPETPATLQTMIRDYRESGIAQGDMPLRSITILISVSYFASTIILIYLIAISRSSLPDRPGSPCSRFAGLTLVGLIFNGVICGSISGVFDRYQGRVAWLTTFVALSWLWSRRIERAPVRTPCFTSPPRRSGRSF